MDRMTDRQTDRAAPAVHLSICPSVIYVSVVHRSLAPGAFHLETHGPFATLWVGLGLCAFYIALVWINTLLGFVLTPLFIVPATWLQDKLLGKAPVRD